MPVPRLCSAAHLPMQASPHALQLPEDRGIDQSDEASAKPEYAVCNVGEILVHREPSSSSESSAEDSREFCSVILEACSQKCQSRNRRLQSKLPMVVQSKPPMVADLEWESVVDIPDFSTCTPSTTHGKLPNAEADDFTGISSDASTKKSSADDGSSSTLDAYYSEQDGVLEACISKSKTNRRPHLLALHGRASNSQVTKMQITNLGLNTLFEVVYLDAPLACNAADAEDMFGISGPFFNWLPEKPLSDDVYKALDYVSEAASKADFIFGFSQGAALALATASCLEARGCRAPACLCICPAGIRLLDLSDIRTIHANSFFCIGMHDEYRAESEHMLSYLSNGATNLYMDSGHGVPKSVGEDAVLRAHLCEWFTMVRPDLSFSCLDTLPLSPCLALVDVNGGELRHVSSQSQPDDAKEMIQWTRAHSWFDTDAASIVDLLTRQSHSSIALWDGNYEAVPAKYGDLVSFIKNEGSLYRFGIGHEDLVSYVVPEGPISAVMFVVVASQCNAAPLGTNSTDEDMHAAFLQLSARMVIASHNMEVTVQKAVDCAQCDGCCELGLKLIEPKSAFAGCFSFDNLHVEAGNSSSLELDGSSSTHLLLRTSGTTSKPKVVPLSMSSVVANGCGIAKSLGLTSKDICINAMPLFHIGGLSASVLATVASGGSVICMPGFQPESFVRMVTRSPDPQPTWYSAVPTIHLAAMQHAQQGAGSFSHSLRFIRSGAAALSSQSAEDMRQFWGCPVLPTYSMTEQMPISQPPCGYDLSHPGSVGIPMVVVAIVDRCLRPLPVCPADQDQKDFVGEICISGPTVMQGYADNDDANSQSFFFLSGEKYFRTGDVGFLDHEGYLHLTGREKELIKVGGEQVSPFVIEEVLYGHHSVQIAMAFGIPNEILGEVVGAAVVLKDSVSNSDNDGVLAELRHSFVKKGLPGSQIPRMYLVSEDELARTPTGKISRRPSRDQVLRSASNQIGNMPAPDQRGLDGNKGAGALDDATLGLRFFLSLIVCLNHIGDHAWPFEADAKPWSWSSAVTSARTVGDIGVVCFGMLAGLMMAVSLKEPIRKGGFMKFFESRLVPIHLTYLIATLLCSVNRMFMCPPSSFEPYTYGSLEVCRGTALRWSWSGTWVASLILAMFTLQAWPFGVLVWHVSYYTWFSSAYQFCVLCFPFIHRILQRATRRGFRCICASHLAVHVLHYLTLVFMEATYLSVRFKNPEFANYFIYAGYMFPPFWAVRFACGVLLGLTFLKYHAQPSQKASAWHWAVITDSLTLLLLVTYALLITFQIESKHRISTVSLLEDRMYCGVIPRVATPILSVWLYGLAVGRGYTAWVCRNRFVVSILSPASYSIYLFHQPIFEWYSILVKGEWWSQRKPGFEWFSPDPIELSGLETLVVILVTILFSVVLTYLTNTYLMGRWLSLVRWITCRRRAAHNHEDVASLVVMAIEDLTGVRAELTDHLQDTGLASLGIAALVSTLNSSKTLNLAAADLVCCETVADVILAIGIKQEATRDSRDQV